VLAWSAVCELGDRWPVSRCCHQTWVSPRSTTTPGSGTAPATWRKRRSERTRSPSGSS